MRYLSLFSGIEAATVAWQPMGWTCVGVSEIDAFPSALLAYHHPEIENLGDVTQLTEQAVAALGRIDIVVFGSPCQDLSLAGKRKGFVDENGATTRSGLFFTAMQIVRWARKHCGLRFALWENVPGAFSSNSGGDFAEVVGNLAGIDSVEIPPKGWGTEGCAVGKEGMVEWSTLDAQWFGVAQRRRRVFALADFGDWASRPPLLLEPESMRRHTAPSRETRESASSNTEGSTGKNSEGGRNTEPGFVLSEVSYVMAHGQGGAEIMQGLAPTLSCNHEAPILAFSAASGLNQAPCLLAGMQVRRLTPVECERLQGFPDGYTQIPWCGKPTVDSHRYKSLGNSMAVPVMRWIGKQLDLMRFF